MYNLAKAKKETKKLGKKSAKIRFFDKNHHYKQKNADSFD